MNNKHTEKFVLSSLPSCFVVEKSQKVLETFCEGNSDCRIQTSYLVSFTDISCRVLFDLGELKRRFIVDELADGSIVLNSEVVISKDNTVGIFMHEIIQSNAAYRQCIKTDVDNLDYEAAEKVEAAAQVLLSSTEDNHGQSFDVATYQYIRSAAMVIDAVRNGQSVRNINFNY